MFADNVGYKVICEGVKHSGVFTDEVLIEFINLATEQSGMTVHYTQVGWHSYTSLNHIVYICMYLCGGGICISCRGNGGLLHFMSYVLVM